MPYVAIDLHAPVNNQVDADDHRRKSRRLVTKRPSTPTAIASGFHPHLTE